MLKKHFFTIMLLLLAGYVSGQKVAYNEAETIAKNHYFIYANISEDIAYQDIIFSEHFVLENDQDTSFLVFNLMDNKGFVIVSADKRYHPIIGYSTEGNFDPENQAPSFKAYMNLHKHELSYLKNENIRANDKVPEEWAYLKQKPDITKNKTNSVEPLLTTNWNQGCGWNAHCPEDSMGPCGRAYAGCVAVAKAQILKYWNFPEQGTGEYSYNHSTYGELSANFGETNYDWDNMPDNSPTDDIAQLMYHVGVSVNMQYGPSESGGYPYLIPESLRNFFNYSVWVHILNIDHDYSEIIKELDESRPLFYAGSPPVGVGHALVLDGYQYNTEINDYYFHFNYGWSGGNNGYYRLYTGNSYFYHPDIFIGAIKPPNCGILEIPYEEDFEGETHFCWTGNVAEGNWEITDSRNYTPNGNKSANYECFANLGCNGDAHLISPQIQLPENPDSTIVLSFMSMNTCPSLYGNTKNRVLISTDNGQNFTELWEPGSVDNEWSKTSLNLDQYAGEIIKIAFKRDDYGSNNTHRWYFDDVKVHVLEPKKPLVSTITVFNITDNTAEAIAKVYEEGSAPVTAKGVVWDNSENPDIQNNLGMTNDGTGIGTFYSSISELTEGTTYFVRAYATNDVGTSYGDILSFTAQQDDFVCGESTVNDADGNVYNTISFNSQCWMAENLKTTKYQDGSDIYEASCIVNFMFEDWSPNEDGAFIWAGNHIQNKAIYGALYNHHAVRNDKGLCPPGWHVPTLWEWIVLEEEVGYYDPFFAIVTGWFGYNGGSKLAGSGEHWYPGGELTDDEDFGETGFNAVPAGWVVSDISAHDNKDAYFWTGDPGTNPFYKRITYERKDIQTDRYLAKTGMSVRCMKNWPSVRTKPIVEINQDSIETGVSIFSSNYLQSPEGGVSGIVYANFENPTIENNTGIVQQAESLNANFYITDLNLETTYYLRAFITDTDGRTYYGNELKHRIFPTPQACPGNETVTDIDGNTYNTVLIGEQCWMAENLKVSRHSNGDSIVRHCLSESHCQGISGGSYTWNMAMYGQMSSNENPSEIQGICPDGWHLPSDAEWLQLENYLIENQYNYNYTQDGNQIAKALASEDADWDSCELPGSPGFFKNKNNSSGFSAYDTRMYSSIDDSWFYYDSSGNFWSSTAQNIDDAISRRIQYNKKALISNQTDKQAALSIRCIKTEPASVISDTHNNYEIFPNPSEGIFTIQWDASFNETRVQIEIYNSRGELISNNNILIGADYKIDLSHQPDGVYFTKITQKQNVSIEKIIKIE